MITTCIAFDFENSNTTPSFSMIRATSGNASMGEFIINATQQDLLVCLVASAWKKQKKTASSCVHTIVAKEVKLPPFYRKSIVYF